MAKIKSLALMNFGKFKNVTCSFDDNLTYLIGVNGAGKSGIGLVGIWFVLKGMALKGENVLIAERYRFIGEGGKHAKGEVIVVLDEKKGVEVKIIRKMLKDGCDLSFEAPEGMVLDQKWIDDLFNVFLISPKAFAELSSKEQALSLGIDTSTYETKAKELKEKYTAINREITALGDVSAVEKIEAVDVKLLLEKKNQINLDNEAVKTHNAKYDTNVTDTASYNKSILGCETEIKRLKALITIQENQKKTHEANKKACDDFCASFEKKELTDTVDIDKQISDSQETNTKATKYTNWVANKAVYDVKKKALDQNKLDQGKNESDKTTYLKSFKLPFGNLTINEGGELLFDNRPIKEPYFSKGELLGMIPRILAASPSSQDKLKYVFFEEFDLIDEDRQPRIINDLIKDGFQIVCEMVGKTKIENSHCILLKEQNIVESYTEAPKEIIEEQKKLEL